MLNNTVFVGILMIQREATSNTQEKPLSILQMALLRWRLRKESKGEFFVEESRTFLSYHGKRLMYQNTRKLFGHGACPSMTF